MATESRDYTIPLFIEKHNLHTGEKNPYPDIDTGNAILGFIQSNKVRVYPSGRRKNMVNNSEGYTIPFDPEARLNTEFNNRRLSALNGFAQSYINEWDGEDAKILSIVLGGYVFEISLPYNNEDDTTWTKPENFGKNFIEFLSGNTSYSEDLDPNIATQIFANIRIEETPLFKGEVEYNTWILRDQEYNSEPLNDLDICLNDKVPTIGNHYFSGLSFSVTPLTAKYTNTSRAYCTREERNPATGVTTHTAQQVYSLCILKTDKNGNWVLNESAMLPFIERGDSPDSIKVKRIEAQSIIYLEKGDYSTITPKPVAVLEVIKTEPNKSDVDSKYKLKFTYADQELTDD